jgi:hypothetical protein
MNRELSFWLPATQVRANAATPFAARAVLYAQLDDELRAYTRFFSAASHTNRILHGLFPAARRCFALSKATEAFLLSVGADLERMNVRLAHKIRRRSMSGDLDRYLIVREQGAVQKHIEALKQFECSPLMGELDGLLQMGILRQCLAKVSAPVRPYMEVLRGVRLALGRPLSFARQGDREAIGLGLIDAVRRRYPSARCGGICYQPVMKTRLLCPRSCRQLLEERIPSPRP